jgi:hypothetical protein
MWHRHLHEGNIAERASRFAGSEETGAQHGRVNRLQWRDTQRRAGLTACVRLRIRLRAFRSVTILIGHIIAELVEESIFLDPEGGISGRFPKSATEVTACTNPPADGRSQ